MNLNQPTTYADLDGGNAESLDSMEMLDSVDSLSAAYADLGKAFYEYRFEEPTPELLLYFDRITELLKTNKDLKRQRNDHIEPMAQPPKEQSIFTTPTNPNLSQVQSSKIAPSSLEASEPALSKSSSNEKAFNSWNPTNNFNDSPWEEPEDLESSFLNQTYNQSSLEQQQTFVAQPQPQQSFQSQGEKKKRGGFSPFRKKEKDRISSFDELPNMENGKGKFADLSESTTPQVRYCPVCHNPVGYSDDFCGNCGARLSH